MRRTSFNNNHSSTPTKAAISVFQKSIMFGLFVQIMFIFMSAFYFFGFSSFSSSGGGGIGILDDSSSSSSFLLVSGDENKERSSNSIMGAAIKLSENIQPTRKRRVNSISGSNSSNNNDKKMDSGTTGTIPTTASSSSSSSTNNNNNNNPLLGMIQTHVVSPDLQDPTQRRNCFAFTAVPIEIEGLLKAVKHLLSYKRYADVIDCVHLSIPHRAIRFSDARYPTNEELFHKYGKSILNDPRIIVHRLPDYGPMTRYIGPLSYEKHHDTSIVIFDIDSENMMTDPAKDLVLLFYSSRVLDKRAMWCYQGENFYVDSTQRVKPSWDTFPTHTIPSRDVTTLDEYQQNQTLSWNMAHFCRGVGGLLFKPKHFQDFWYNQSEYHESCFWDDDRWVSYQIDRQGFPLKVVHPTERLINATNLIQQKHKRISLSKQQEEGQQEQQQQQQSRRRRLQGIGSAATTTADASAPAAAAARLPHEQVIASLQEYAASMQDKVNNANDESMQIQQLRPQPQQSLRHRRLGSLTRLTNRLQSDQTCPLAWLSRHPDVYPTARAPNITIKIPSLDWRPARARGVALPGGGGGDTTSRREKLMAAAAARREVARQNAAKLRQKLKNEAAGKLGAGDDDLNAVQKSPAESKSEDRDNDKSEEEEEEEDQKKDQDKEKPSSSSSSDEAVVKDEDEEEGEGKKQQGQQIKEHHQVDPITQQKNDEIHLKNEEIHSKNNVRRRRRNPQDGGEGLREHLAQMKGPNMINISVDHAREVLQGAVAS